MSDLCTIKKSTLDGIAEAIQSKTGESGGMLPSEMAGKILSIPGGEVQGDWLKTYTKEIIAGENTITNAQELWDYFSAAAAEFNEGVLQSFSIIGDPKIYNLFYNSIPIRDTHSNQTPARRYRNGLRNAPIDRGYDATLPVGTRVVLYIAEEVAY